MSVYYTIAMEFLLTPTATDLQKIIKNVSNVDTWIHIGTDRTRTVTKDQEFNH